MLQVSQLCKRFLLTRKEKKSRGSRILSAVDQVSFECHPYSITGMLGTNGAGKTTTLRLLSTALTPTDGQISWNDRDISRQLYGYRRKLGFISGDTKLYRRLTVAENLTYFGQLYKLTSQQIKDRIEQLEARLQLSSYLHRKADDLSTGMYQRANLARALIHDPSLLILDEPTTGLDVSAAQIVLQVMQEERDLGKTVIFSTHHMHEVERLCDQIVAIHQGRLGYFGDISGFLTQQQQPKLDLALLSLVEGTKP